MNIYDIIEKKKHSQPLSEEEISYFVEGYTNGDIPDYQASALLMAIYFAGLDKEETFLLTKAMLESGESVDLSKIPGIKADKHSTGGVGDKTSLILIPIIASLGLKSAKMSGRGLGHTGGTIDKLESIPGLKTSFERDSFFAIVEKCGAIIASQTANIAPADKKIYALRDVTATVDNVSLIASSIMSKKLACGADALVLDVKCGSGAFMKTEQGAQELASEMVGIAKRMGKSAKAIITDMSQPLGYYIGNALEVKESIYALKGNGPSDLMEVVYALASCLLTSVGMAETDEAAEEMSREAIASGKALDSFKHMVEAQGGDASYIQDESKLAASRLSLPLKSSKAGYIEAINCEETGLASLASGAGRQVIGESIDPGAGIVFSKKIGDPVGIGDEIATIYSSSEEKLMAAAEKLALAISVGENKADPPKLILGKVE
ncbi:MAG: thymidine phosphorylase [Eubacteriaceae bacterium]|nr:thymidine phosphorylase [Eubacteriaceae bacterium]